MSVGTFGRTGPALLGTLLLLAGCGPGQHTRAPRQAEDAASTADAPAESEWAALYGGPVDGVPMSDSEQALWRDIEQGPPLSCQHDPRLTLAARRHADDLVKSPGAIGDGQIDRLRFTLWRLGGTDYAIEPVITTLDPTGMVFLKDIVAAQRAKWTHCGLGIAASGTKRLAVWIGVERAVEMDPFPVEPPPASRVTLSGIRTRAADGAVQLFVARPDGSVMLPSRTRSDRQGRFAFQIPIGPAGRYDVELLYDTGNGSETVLLLPLFAGIAPDERPVVVPDPSDGQERSGEQALLSYLNDTRKKLGLFALKPDARLRRVAADHTRDMVTAGFFGHVSPRHGALADRLRRADLHPEKSAENIASSASLYRIHRNLWESPAHRINMVNPEYTHVGIAVLPRGDKLIATEIFARW